MKVFHHWIGSLVWALVFSQVSPVRSQRLRAAPSTTTTNVDNNNNKDESHHLHHRKLSVTDLVTNFQMAKAKFYDKLKQDYGPETFDQFFFYKQQEDGQTVSAGRAYHIPASGQGGVSWWRMQRKIMMKILNYLIGNTRQPFVWATGGHSASAGHGNLFTESYTAVFEQNGKDIFASVGMDLVGRNYAMGGTSSGMEISSCMEEIFGMDIDILSWDYGMTDGRGYDRMEHYFYRAGYHPNRPGLMTGDINNDRFRIDVMKAMEAMGLPSFYRESTFQKAQWNKLPDTEGLTPEQVDAMPTHVRAFRCGNQFEKGDNFCAAYKFTVTDDENCEKRKYRVSWHPGWKWQAIEGNMKVLTMMELIDDSLQYLVANSTEPALLLKQLKEEEDVEYKAFEDAPLPEWAQKKDNSLIDPEIFYRQRSACHTARLPAQARIIGAVTSTSPGTEDNYDVGVSMDEAFNQPIPDGALMPLAFKQKDRQVCPIKLQADFKDGFYVTSKSEGFGKLVLPNDAEKRIYGHEGLNGYVAICVAACGFGKCEEGCLEGKMFNEGKAGTLQVNGIPVVNMTEFSQDCSLLKGPDGYKWNPNSNGRFEIAAKADKAFRFIRFSSVVIW